jgi:transcriptional regulator with PAS, ATPase and Fis domain
MHNWIKEFPAAITVCDADGIITEMNEKSVETFRNDGGAGLLGKNLLDCHPEPSRTQVEGLLQDRKTNAYTIEKAGKKKLIYQTPWYENGEFRGLVELSLEIPFEMEHFIRVEST